MKNNGLLKRSISGMFGKISYRRTELVPADQKSAETLFQLEGIKSIFPLDIALNYDKLPFKMSIRLMLSIAREAVRSRSYEDAKNNINEKYHISVSDYQVEKITDYIASLVLEEKRKIAETAPRIMQEKVDGRHRHKRKNDVLYFEIDGAMVHIRDKSKTEDGKIVPGWMESKHALTFHSSDIYYYKSKTGELTYTIKSKDFIGYIGSSEEFEKHFIVFAKEHQCDLCSEVVVISDGAQWIHKMINRIIPRATHILDLYHAKENAGKFIKEVIHNESYQNEFMDKINSLLDNGDIDGILKILEPYKDAALPIGIPNFYTYVNNHRDCMNYDLYKRKGYFVGSGAIESGNKQVMQNRMKLQGMMWMLENAQGMLSLKELYESSKWDRVEKIVYSHFGVENIPSNIEY